MPLRHYLQFTDLNAEDYAHIFKRAALIKAKFKSYEKVPAADRPNFGHDF
jgi:diadenosine tetraphosphate (Ap4A) HIT family hydrolase